MTQPAIASLEASVLRVPLLLYLQCKKQMAANPRMLKEQQEDLPQWQEILASLRKVEPLAVTAQKLRETDIPKHESELERANGRHQAATRKAEEVSA